MGHIRIQKRIFSVVLAVLTCLFLILWGEGMKAPSQFNWVGVHRAIAQTNRTQEIAAQVYQRLPDFPRENQYVRKDTGKVDPDNTLVSRLIRYHLYVKSRPSNYRLDWKLTLADYLGANEYLVDSSYPGFDTLRENPLSGDRAAIDRLNLKQRSAFVDTIVRIFNPRYDEIATPQPSPTATPTPDSRPVIRLPRAGDADLLKP